MNFLAPLAFAFAATIPVVILFYLLKRRRTVRLVASTVLWQRFLGETEASAPFQKLRRNWLLMLQLLLLTLAILALARPYFSGTQKPSDLRVLIIDASASMQATDVGPSRFGEARAQALKWVEALSGRDQMVVILAGAEAQVKQSATSDKASLRRALNACAPTDAPTRLAPALRMGEGLVRDRPTAEIHLFSDGAAPGLEEFENKALPLVYHRIGVSGENLGIVAMDLRANPDQPRRRQVYAAIANSGTNPHPARVEFRLDDLLLETRSITIEGGETARLLFELNQTKDGVASVRIDGKDALEADNQASILSTMPRPARVLLVTRGNRFLEKALAAVPNLELNVASRLDDSATVYDVVVLDDFVPVSWPKANLLSIHAFNTNWATGWRTLEQPAITDWRASHPLLRYVSLDNVQVRESVAVTPPGWAVSLVDSPQASLMFAGQARSQKVIWIGFDLLESNWPLRLSFPIFIANAMEWLDPANEQSRMFMKTGEPFRLRVPGPVTGATMLLPDGTTRRLETSPGQTELVFGDTFARGLYRCTAGTNRISFCVNLLDPLESRIAPREELRFSKRAGVVASGTQSTHQEFWRWFAAIGFIVLLWEWWYYHRRSA